MRRTWILGLAVMALAIVGTVNGQATRSAMTGLGSPVGLSTKTANTSAASYAPNTARTLQTPIKPKASSFGLPKITFPLFPKFNSFSTVPRASNPFQPTAPKGHNPFDTARPVATGKSVAK